MITYNIEYPEGLIEAAKRFLRGKFGARLINYCTVGNTLVFAVRGGREVHGEVGDLCLILDQACAAYIDARIGRFGFTGPRPWPVAQWDPAKFLPLKPIPQAAPAPVGNLATTIAIPYGNDTPVRWCLWDTDSGLYVTKETRPAPCTYTSRAPALRSLSLARAMRWEHWTSTRPTSA